MFLTFEVLVPIISLSVLVIFLYNYYDNIFSIFNFSSNYKIKNLQQSLLNIRLALIGGALATPEQISNAVNTTVVTLTDEELNELILALISEIGNSNIISVSLLQSFGLYTHSVMAYLESLGYIIL